ncbi:TlpA family protein disulfide reductase [Mucilaginibacter sp. FT3.2]|uniref:TlpA family protein disulfide reductase n=1 Tax=Mucilaginibacter sp. FT3.2 TaxID=2723090 RepID=UPI0016128B94|nr:TlpA disulfide reductase family protein [Mucilaginibacter sp. FT3.2]MBB6233219.1 thiol-disulfide isomerase/thioredoxin [Mucilaginibacter sp. FT3.2]
MLKIIFTFIITVFFISTACAQKSFDVTIKLDSSIIPQNVHYQYYDGKNITSLPDTFGNNRTIVLKGKYYSSLVSFNISYAGLEKINYDNDFFISDKPAIIDFYFKANGSNKLGYNSIKNAVPIYDTAANKTWGKLTAFMTDTSVAKENIAFDSFLTQNKGFGNNDSLRQIFNTFYKARLNRMMLFFKKYPDDYFSFWYFIQQVAQPNSILSKDTAYLKEQLTYLRAVFPARFIGSTEGLELIRAYEAKIKPTVLKLNEAIPTFSVTTIDGKKISLTELKGKYVLLDFWATWCPPCLAEMPFIKAIRKNYPAEKLVIIGISQDNDSAKLGVFVKKQEMNWLHIYDRNKALVNLYGIEAIPTLILMDKAGKMIYKSDFVEDDKDRLLKVLEVLN